MSDGLPTLSTRQKVAAFACMCLGMFIALIDIQIVSASLRDIGGGLSAGADDTAWVQTAYLIAEIIVIPLSGWLSRVMSTRWLFAASAAGFTLTSLLCAVAWNIQSMIAFRALQGFLGGSMIPLVFTTAFIYFNGKQRIIAASTIGAIASLAPTLGPAVGGWITDISSWHWLFYINLLPGLFVTLSVPLLVRVDQPNLALLKGADYLGIVLMAVFLGCLEYTLEEGPRWNWFSDSTITLTAWVALASGVLFIWRCLEIDEPIVDLRALGERNFALGCLFSFITGIGIFATIYLTPLFLGRVRGYGALDIGIAVFSTGIFQLLAIPVYAFLASRIDLRWILMLGLALFGLSMWNFAPITHDWGGKELLLPQAIRGFAQQLTVAPTVTLTLGSLAPARLKLASGLFNLMRNLGGAIGIAACATVLNDRSNLHFLRLAEHLNSRNEEMNLWLEHLSSSAQALGQNSLDASQIALRQLWALTWREAQTLTYADAFLVIMVCFILATVLVPLMRKVQPPQQPSADGH
ncbi:drug resistance transporter, EmrB/QacA subfamily [Pseudomonas asplenii]|uniref:Drug resistance transporter, EmrB/QacA subfamily n=1 Tax=Pseudomonas asplenii TaxID=53407 RepID=A0A0N0E3P1_9PSED|nr:DHA2 family efflux MFS transporter permease subunit [Pseudomonas fuscovaginae]KPA90286.1 drug resistance transporter, EmrB/QacA subfamily [Pseudomonas fuscovaginae]